LAPACELAVEPARCADPRQLEWVKFSGLSWAKDGSGFYYSRFPQPKAAGTYQSLNENQQIYFHKLGTKQSADRLLFSTPRQPELNNVAQVSDDGRWLIVYSSSGTDPRYQVSLVAPEAGREKRW
jgi:prolyl oligopeptidase